MVWLPAGDGRDERSFRDRGDVSCGSRPHTPVVIPDNKGRPQGSLLPRLDGEHPGIDSLDAEEPPVSKIIGNAGICPASHPPGSHIPSPTLKAGSLLVNLTKLMVGKVNIRSAHDGPFEPDVSRHLGGEDQFTHIPFRSKTPHQAQMCHPLDPEPPSSFHT